MITTSQKCHGADVPTEFGASWVCCRSFTSTGLPHSVQVASAARDDGARYAEQVSHQGMPAGYSAPTNGEDRDIVIDQTVGEISSFFEQSFGEYFR